MIMMKWNTMKSKSNGNMMACNGVVYDNNEGVMKTKVCDNEY